MLKNLLEHINSTTDLRQLSASDLPQLARELRQYIIEIVATKEGHLGASLGVVELTIALHYVFNTPDDLLVWDVGHQAYVHKILTGRKNQFHTNRQHNGLSGFPKRDESVYDAFGTGHSSTSISAALGMAIASQLKGDNKHHIAIIGENKKMLIFSLDELPEMSKGKGVRLQKYKDSEVLFIKTFNPKEGLIIEDSGGRKRVYSDTNDWIGKRAQSGRLVPKGFPRLD